MSSPYVGEIRMFAGNFNPAGWALCQGQLMPISENETLFQLLGTTYGGDGQSTFGIPDLQGRVPVHAGTNAGTSFNIGEKTGVESVTLTVNQIPQHNHALLATSATPSLSPANAIPAVATSTGQLGVLVYGASTGAGTTLHPNTIQSTTGNQPHDNMQPFLCINFIISLFGIFPTQS